jgi:hypothetical protein
MSIKGLVASGLIAVCLSITIEADAEYCSHFSQTWGEFHNCAGQGFVWGEWVLNNPPPGGITQPTNQILHAYNAGAVEVIAAGVNAWGDLLWNECRVSDKTNDNADATDSTGCFWDASTYYALTIY